MYWPEIYDLVDNLNSISGFG